MSLPLRAGHRYIRGWPFELIHNGWNLRRRCSNTWQTRECDGGARCLSLHNPRSLAWKCKSFPLVEDALGSRLLKSHDEPRPYQSLISAFYCLKIHTCTKPLLLASRHGSNERSMNGFTMARDTGLQRDCRLVLLSPAQGMMMPTTLLILKCKPSSIRLKTDRPLFQPSVLDRNSCQSLSIMQHGAACRAC